MSSDLIRNVRKISAPKQINQIINNEIFCLAYEIGGVNSHPITWTQKLFIGDYIEVDCFLAKLATMFIRNELYTEETYRTGLNLDITTALDVLTKAPIEMFDTTDPLSKKSFSVIPNDEGVKRADYYLDRETLVNRTKIHDSNLTVLKKMTLEEPLMWVLLNTYHLKAGAYLS